MQLTTLITIASAAVAASATMYEVVPRASLEKRQGGDSFIPGTTCVLSFLLVQTRSVDIC